MIVPETPLWNRVKFQIHIKPTDRPHIRDYKTQIVDKKLIEDNNVLMLLPFVWNWPTVVCAESYITQNDQITLCDVPDDVRRWIIGSKGHCVINVIYHLDTGDWILHGGDEKGDHVEYEWTNPNPQIVPLMDVRENPVLTDVSVEGPVAGE